MDDLPDYELRKSAIEEAEPAPPPAPPRGGTWVAIAALSAAAALVVVVVFGLRHFMFSARPAAPATAAQASAPPKPAPEAVLGGQAEPIDLPPLDQTDALVRRLVGALSSNPRVAAWLATDGLVRNFTVVVENVAGGRAPGRLLPMLKPRAPFRVVERGGEMTIDPRSYERYTAIADAVASIDAAGAAKVYATLKPRIEEAHREQGFPDQPFDRTLERAMAMLLAVPVPDGDLRVEPVGVVYGFADLRFENLNGAQKQLLRMGPANARAIQAKLREIALALGVPADRLSPL